MKVFLSWSGKHSHDVAEALGSWIEDVLQGTKAWISSEDIEKGSLWFNDISTELTDTTTGILVLTRSNINAPWILFEAGALSKGLSSNRVCPFLVDLAQAELNPPLSMFNCTQPSRKDLLKLISTINANNSSNRLKQDKLLKAFGKWWPDFNKRFEKINTQHKTGSPAPVKTQGEMTAEILDTVRFLARHAQWSDFDTLLKRAIVDNNLLKLSPREERIIRMLYGVGTSRPLSIDEVARHFDASSKVIVSIRDKALNKLTHLGT